MAIVTISRGCFSHGKEIAEKTAEILGYKVVSREILLEAAEFFHVSEKELLKQIENYSTDQARSFLEKEDIQRAKWTQYIYNFDIHDPKLYDLVIKIGKLNIQDACDIISTAVKTNAYNTTEACRKKLEDIALSSYIKVALHDFCRADVISKDGNIHVKAFCSKIQKSSYTSSKMQHETRDQVISNMAKKISDIVHKIDGVKELICDIEPPSFH
ncbi:histidine kinase [Candidatus Magnetomorum sp. HK-1]|nr:histidine kinase [Candidatus Magnetomorum sp. HK-1]